MGNLRQQLNLLWGAPLLKKILAIPLKEMLDAGVSLEEGAGPSQPSTPVQSNNPAAIIRRAIEARTNRYGDELIFIISFSNENNFSRYHFMNSVFYGKYAKLLINKPVVCFLIYRANSSKHYRKLGSPDCTKAALICSMYHTALLTMKQINLDILTGKRRNSMLDGHIKIKCRKSQRGMRVQRMSFDWLEAHC